MHKNTIKLCFYQTFILTFLCNFSISYSQVLNSNWQWLHPKPQGNLLFWCKMWDANLWYITGQNGTFMKTTDGGVSWIINNNAGKILINGARCDIWDAHFFNQNTGILVGVVTSVTKTTNGGVTFDTIPGLFVNGIIWYAVYFLNDNTGYIAGSVGNGGRLAKTTDGGSSWQFIESIIPSRFRDVFTFNDTLILMCDALGNVERSTDGGAGWTILSTGTSSELTKFCFINKDTGFVCGRNGTVLRTINGGLNWTSTNNGLPSTSIFRDMDYRGVGQNTEIYLTGDPYYIYKTSNLGASWDTVGFWGSNQTYMGDDHHYNSTDLGGGDTLLTVGGYGLINKRNNAGNRIFFTDFVKFGRSRMYDIWIDENKIWAIGEPTTVGVTFDQLIYSSNGGANWVAQNTGNTSEIFSCIYMLNSSTGYIAGAGGMLRKTINGGASWEQITSPTSSGLQKVQFLNENTGWVFGGVNNTTSLMFKTTDAASSWTQQFLPGTAGYVYSAQMLNENTGWAVGQQFSSNIYKTTDGGSSWIPYSHNIQGTGVIIDIDMLDANTGYICGSLLSAKTTNGGINWVEIPVPFPASYSYQFTDVDFISPEIGMLLDLVTTLKTTNGGSSWIIEYIGTQAGSFVPSPGFSRLKMISEDTAYACGYYSSVLKYSPYSPIGIIEWQTGAPKEFELYQNYPNPFNPSTTIKFAIAKPGNFTLKVYDITGRLVQTVMDNLSLNPGTVKYTFDGSNLASGVYFYSLYVDGNLVNTRKMVLIK